MAIERTLSIIKPDATKRNLTGKIVAKFEDAGLRVVASKRIHLSPAQAGAFYAEHGVTANVHLVLSQYGLKKRYGEDCSAEDAEELYQEVCQLIASDRMQVQPAPEAPSSGKRRLRSVK